MKVSEDIRKMAVTIKTSPEMDESCLENLALRGDNVSRYAIAMIVERDYKTEKMKETVRYVLNNAYKMLDECKGMKQGVVDVLLEINSVQELLGIEA